MVSPVVGALVTVSGKLPPVGMPLHPPLVRVPASPSSGVGTGDVSFGRVVLGACPGADAPASCAGPVVVGAGVTQVNAECTAASGSNVGGGDPPASVDSRTTSRELHPKKLKPRSIQTGFTPRSNDSPSWISEHKLSHPLHVSFSRFHQHVAFRHSGAKLQRTVAELDLHPTAEFDVKGSRSLTNTRTHAQQRSTVFYISPLWSAPRSTTVDSSCFAESSDSATTTR